MTRTYLTLAIVVGLAGVARADITPAWTTDTWGNPRVLITTDRGRTYRLNWTKPGGGTTTTTHTGTNLPQYITPPSGYDVKNCTVDVKNKENSRATKTVYGWDDHPSYALAYHQVTGGSVNLGGESFTLAGSYQVRADSFDRDESSPTYGEIHGRFLSGYAALTGVSTGGHTLSFNFAEDEYFTTSVADALANPGMDGATSSFNITMAGTAIIDGATFIPFTGLVAGVATYTPSRGDSFESYNMNLTLATAIGTTTGTMESDGIVEVVPTPAASVLAGLGGVFALRRRR